MASGRPVLYVVMTGCLALAAVVVGCERGEQKRASSSPSTADAASQPTAAELANMRDYVQAAPSRTTPALPPGHPPIDGQTPSTRPATVARLPAPAVELKYDVPPTWRREPVRTPLRTAQYRLPRAEGDSEDGELAVFGAGVSGEAEAIVSLWRRQFSTPEGEPVPDEAVVRESLAAGGLAITVVDVAGRFGAAGMPMGGHAGPARDNFRLLGAIVETPRGPWYFKALGPARTLGAHRAGFMDMLRSIHTE